jgi:hypothetical protein
MKSVILFVELFVDNEAIENDYLIVIKSNTKASCLLYL